MFPQIEGIAASSDPEVQKPDRSFVRRWKHQKLFDKGFLAVPTSFLQNYAQMKPHPLTTGEALFVLHLTAFKWDAKAPFPGYKTLAARMGVTDKATRRYAQKLEAKRCLRREMQHGQTNRFDLTPLFDAFAKMVEQEASKDRAKKRLSNKDRRDTLVAWHGKLVDAYRVMSDEDKLELEQWERNNLDGHSVGTSDWPGWERHIGKRPH